MRRVLVVGATGSIGRVVIPALVAAGLEPRALVRSRSRATAILGDVELAMGDLDDAAGLTAAVDGVDGIVMVHGAREGTPPADVDYGAVPAVLRALGGSRPRIVLMTSMAVTHATGSWREAMHWKRRGERLLRASGLPATVVRPGWFDLEPPEYRAVSLEQGDLTAVDSRRPVARSQVADALVQSLLCEQAVGRTFELFAAPGSPPNDWCTLFAALAPDQPGDLDAALDPASPPPQDEPERWRLDLEQWRRA